MRRALWVGGLCGLLSLGCSNGDKGGDAGAPDGATGTGARSLVGIWDLTLGTTLSGTAQVMSTVTIGQNSLTVTAPAFTLSAVRTGNVLAFTDQQSLGHPENDVVLTATQTPAPFNAGILPFDLGGSWTMQIVPAGQSTVMTCTLTVSSTEIDGSCQEVPSNRLFFSFTSAKTATAASSFGDLGGTWMSTWIWPGMSGGTFPCKLDFSGNSITTCPGVAAINGNSAVTGIAFAYDGANTASGAVQGWAAEYSATRR